MNISQSSEFNEKILLNYYSAKKWSEKTIEISEREAYTICNVFADYIDFLKQYIEDHESKENMIWTTQYLTSCIKLKEKFENELDYNRDLALEKCKNKQSKKEDQDAGEDAMILSARKKKS